MCMYAYIAADERLPEIKCERSEPAFDVSEVTNKRLIERLRKHFTKPHVYRVGAPGCACGFNVDSVSDLPGHKSVGLLREYLQQAVAHGPIEFFSCWGGDEDDKSVAMRAVTPAFFGGDTFELPLRELLIVRSV